jgi:hypothetical protein
VNASPNVIKDLFGGKTILGIPAEIATALGGGGAGLALIKVIEQFYPTINPRIKDRIEDLVPLVAREYNRILKEQGGGAGKAPTASSTTAFVPKRLMLCDAHPGVIYLWACPANHHSTMTTEDVNAGNNKKRKEARTTPREDCRMIATAVASALMDKEGRTPSSSDEGLNAICVCETEVPAEIARYRTEKAKADKVAATVAMPKGPSLVTIPEVRGAFAAVGRAIGRTVEGTGKGISAVACGIGDGIAKAAGAGERVVTKLPGQVKALDDKVAAHAKRVGDEQERLLVIERFARSKKVMDRTGFKAWALSGNIDLTNLAAVPQRFMSGERR